MQRKSYEEHIADVQILPEWENQLAKAKKLYEDHQSEYDEIWAQTNVPSPIVFCIHMIEGSGSFKTHLHNGDSLNARTVNVPAGRPLTGNPPFTWTESAIDAIRYDKLDKHPWGDDWAKDLEKIEKYNGSGYIKRGIASPYLWSGTNQYDKGKYVADGKFDPDATSKQLGAVALLLTIAPDYFESV